MIWQISRCLSIGAVEDSRANFLKLINEKDKK